jgi:hypothetical protein
MARLAENDGGLARPGETRRESHDKNPSGKSSLFQQLVLDVRHCCDEIAHEIGVLAERQPSPALAHLHGDQLFETIQLQTLSSYNSNFCTSRSTRNTLPIVLNVHRIPMHWQRLNQTLERPHSTMRAT